MSKWCIDKENVFIRTIFRHIALLVTEISSEDQNFKNIPRNIYIWVPCGYFLELNVLCVLFLQTDFFFLGGGGGTY